MATFPIVSSYGRPPTPKISVATFEHILLDCGENDGHMNPYHALQVREDATPSEIRQCYRKLSLYYHPGRKRCRQNYHKFTILSKSYETLIDNQTRHKYDELLHQELSTRNKTRKIWQAEPKTPTSPSFFNFYDSDSDGDELSTILGSWLNSPVGDSKSKTNKIEKDVPQLLLTPESPTVPFTQKRSKHLGPLWLLYESRMGEEFRDPYDVFEQVFGSKLYERVYFDDGDCCEDAIVVYHKNRSDSPMGPWSGTCERNLENNSLMMTTTRVLAGRKLTRTVEQDIDGIRRITINSEEILPASSWIEYDSDSEELQKQCNDWNVCTMDTLDRLCVGTI